MPDPEVTPSPFGDASEEPSRPKIIDAIADLIQMFVDFVRQETGDIVREKVVLPTQKAGQVVAFALAAAAALAMGIAFISVGALLLLAQLLGWPGALFSIGGVLLIGAASLTAVKMRSIQR